MTFNFPSLRGRVIPTPLEIDPGLPLFRWSDLHEKEEPIGRGTFGLVFVARRGSEKVVVKKLLGDDDQERGDYF